MSFKSAFSFSNLNVIQLKLAKHKEVLAMILSASPEKIQPHIKDCVINDNKLLVYVSSAAWASQLRFYSTQIIEAVNKQDTEKKINQLRIRILSPIQDNSQHESTKKIPSTESIDLIRKNAGAFVEGKLKTALLNLSKTLSQQANKNS